MITPARAYRAAMIMVNICHMAPLLDHDHDCYGQARD